MTGACEFVDMVTRTRELVKTCVCRGFMSFQYYTRHARMTEAFVHGYTREMMSLYTDGRKSRQNPMKIQTEPNENPAETQTEPRGNHVKQTKQMLPEKNRVKQTKLLI